MALTVQNNLQMINTQNKFKINRQKISKSAEKLSSGYKINRAADDAAGLTISEKMRWQIRGLNRASRNIEDGISVTQIADGALQEVHNILNRMNELAVQAANDTNTKDDREAIQKEIKSLKSEINRIGNDTEFNTIKLFKPTAAPIISGNPRDVLIYNEDYNGKVREGGIIYNGIRYAYDDMGQINFDNEGNIKKGTYAVKVLGETGQEVSINLIFDGGNRTPSGREYHLEPKNTGVYVDDILYSWDEIKDESGRGLDVNDIKTGKYSFNHAGVTFSFEVQNENMDLEGLITSLSEDGLTTFKLFSTNATTSTVRIHPSISISDVTVTNAKQDYIPGNNSSNTSSYKMYADENKVYMYITSGQSHGQGEVKLTEMTWEQLGLTTDFDTDDGINSSSTVTGGEVSTTYQYSDSLTGIAVNFTVDSEVSKGQLIAAINSWDIDVSTNNRMIFTIGGSSLLSAGTHSTSLDAYGTHYDMGRDMSGQLTLATSVAMNNNAGSLSFDLTDANGTVYTFTSTSNTSVIESRVDTQLSSYISSYETYLARKAFGYSATMPTASRTQAFSFSSPGGYSISINYKMDFSGWLDESDFDVTPVTDSEGNITSYKATIKADSKTAAETLADTLASEIVTALESATVSANTDNNTIIANNSISSTQGISNVRYSSGYTVGEREMKIQAGCLEGQKIVIKLPAMNATILQVAGIDVTSYENASSAIKSINNAIEMVSDMRSQFGATENRLRAAKELDDNISENTSAAESRLRDTDMAEEMVNYSKNNILQRAAEAMMAQINANSQNIVQLLN